MLTSLALLFLVALLLGSIFQKLKLPPLLGMIITGMILGPYVLDLLDPTLLNLSDQLRKMALVIILVRAGLSLQLEELKKVGRPALLLCFLPACFELLAVVLLAPIFLHITLIEAAVVGTVMAAVSPAVIVPRMIKLIEEGYGKEKSIPQMILAGASVDDVFVIILFTSAISLATGGTISSVGLLQIPVSIIMGILVGFVVGIALVFFFRKIHMRDSIKVIIILSISFLLLELEQQLQGIIPFSALLSIMSLGIIIYQKHYLLGKRISAKCNKLWVAAEILLFVLVGASVDLSYASKVSVATGIVIVGAMTFRMIGVVICLLKTNLNKKEKLFCMIAYSPKATVQAAIGAIPLSMGLGCGPIVLTMAVLSILITAPFGAILIDWSYDKLLTTQKQL